MQSVDIYKTIERLPGDMEVCVLKIIGSEEQIDQILGMLDTCVESDSPLPSSLVQERT